MNEETDRKSIRRDSLNSKVLKKNHKDDFEKKSMKHQKYDYRKQIDEMEQEELWEEWKEYYR